MAKRGRKPKKREIVWSPELAYAVGLMASDGNLSPDGRHLIFVSKDREQLENLHRCFDLDVSIGRDRIQWGDVFLYQFLLSIGLTPRKSLTIGVVAVPDPYFFDFLRGVFDGDGSFYSYYDKRWRSSFMFYLNFTSASPAHIVWLQATITRLLGVFGHVSRTRATADRSGVETLRYAKAESLLIMRRMYADPRSPRLSRKRLKINSALRIVDEPLMG